MERLTKKLINGAVIATDPDVARLIDVIGDSVAGDSMCLILDRLWEYEEIGSPEEIRKQLEATT
jgi:hypothetical protein